MSKYEGRKDDNGDFDVLWRWWYEFIQTYSSRLQAIQTMTYGKDETRFVIQCFKLAHDDVFQVKEMHRAQRVRV